MDRGGDGDGYDSPAGVESSSVVKTWDGMGYVSVDLRRTQTGTLCSVFYVLYIVCWTLYALLHTLCRRNPSVMAIIIIITSRDSSPDVVLQRRYRICTQEKKRKDRRRVSIHGTRHLISDRRTLKRLQDPRTPLSTPSRGPAFSPSATNPFPRILPP